MAVTARERMLTDFSFQLLTQLASWLSQHAEGIWLSEAQWTISCLVSDFAAVQVSLLQRMVSAEGWEKIEVLTVDKCQGRDMPALLVSLVRCATLPVLM